MKKSAAYFMLFLFLLGSNRSLTAQCTTPVISGVTTLCSGDSTILSIPAQPGASYCWTKSSPPPTWQNVGNAGFSASTAANPSLAFNGSTPYVSFSDEANINKATVMKFNGTTWENVGSAGFSVGPAYYTSLAINNSIPYVAYVDGANSTKATVMKFNGVAWENVGNAGFSAAGGIGYPSLAFNGSTPYVAYTDGGSGGKATVMKFNGTTWENVGNAGFSAGQAYYTKLVFNGNTPYVAYADAGSSFKATVMKFNGIFWENVGNAGFTASTAEYTSLAFNGSTPYVGFMDEANNYKPTVMKFNGIDWEVVGNAGFSVGSSQSPSLAIDGSTPYMVFTDFTNGGKATAMKFNGVTWEIVGNAGFSEGFIPSPSIVFNGSTPYVVYQDGANGYKAAVMKLEPTCLSSTNSLLTNMPGTYSVTVSIAGCTASASTTITENPIPSVTAPGAQTYFACIATSAITLSGTPTGVVFDISGGSAIGLADTNGLTAIPSFTPTAGTATVSITPKANGCTGATATYGITVYGPIASLNPVTYLSSGDSTTLSIPTQPGANYCWTSSNGPYTWENVGNAGFSAFDSEYTSLAFQGSTPYVAYRDGANGNKATVMKFNGVAWENVGNAGFSAGVAHHTSLAFNGSTPYVAYNDGANSYKATVMKFNGIAWENVGNAGFSAGGWAYYTSLVFNGSTPYVAYSDGGNSYKATVMKFNGIAWENVGNAGLSAGTAFYTSIAFNGSVPYVAYQDLADSSKATVMKFNGNTWENVGNAGFSASTAEYISFAINSSTPYIAYREAANGNKPVVMKFNGTTWENVGNLGVSVSQVIELSLVFNGNTPYVVYTDFENLGKASVMKFNGAAWENVGNTGFSENATAYLSLAFNNSTPYVAFRNNENYGKATVMKFDPICLSNSNSLLVSNLGTYTVTVDIGGCTASASTTITDNPIPTVIAPDAQAYCAGTVTNPITLSGTPTGVVFDISGGSTIGLADATNLTVIPSFTASLGTATISITPKANGYSGSTVTYNIAVNNQLNYYSDVDMDGFGSISAIAQPSCSPIVGKVTNKTDCNDTNEAINPSISEICNDLDDDCDNKIDDADPSVTGRPTWYRDVDKDAFGTESKTRDRCDKPAGFVLAGGDCLDNNKNINPAAIEVCDGIDDDCDGLIDDADPNLQGLEWFADADNDGYGNPNSVPVNACNQPQGLINNCRDCNDENALINFGKVETTNGIDDDCDGSVDNICANVSSVSIVHQTSNSVILDWISPNDAINFNVQYRAVGTLSWVPIPPLSFPNSFGEIIGLTASTNYELRIRTRCSAFTPYSAPIPFETRPVGGVCARPSIGRTEVVGPYNVRVWWNFAPNATEYTFRYRPSTSPVWTNVFITSNKPNISLARLLPNTSYIYQIRSLCNGVWTNYSTLGTFTTEDKCLPDLLQPLVINGENVDEDDIIQVANEAKDANILLVPNPTKGLCHITCSDLEGTTAKIQVLDIMGRTLLSWSANITDGHLGETFNTADLPSAVYIIRVETSTEVRSQSLIKE